MTTHDPQQLRTIVEAALGDRLTELEVTFRPMFGGVTGYTRGRNFVSLSNVGLALKLSPEDRDELLAVPGARPLQYEPDSPPSKQSVVVPETMLEEGALLLGWLGRSIRYCQTLPLPKKRTARKSPVGG